MRLTVDLLGHHLEITLDRAEPDQPQHDTTLDALVERSDPWAPPIGFTPPRRPEETV